jgi:hypothetical protein
MPLLLLLPSRPKRATLAFSLPYYLQHVNHKLLQLQ